MTATLDVRAVSEMSAAKADVAALGDAARQMGNDVAAAGSDASRATADLSGLGDGADNVASKSSQATGALGALAGGLEAVGLEKYAAGLQGAAIATDVASGAGDVLNLVAETQVGRFVATTAASIAHRSAMIAGTVATEAMAAGQAVLNAVMSANPLALVAIALLAIGAALIYAYKHSETFRDIVDGAFTRAKDVIDDVVDAGEDIIGFFRDLPGEAKEAWDDTRRAVEDAWNGVPRMVGDVVDDVVGKVEDVKQDVADKFSAMFAPISTAVGWVQDLIDKINSIDFPDFPDKPGWLPRGVAGTEPSSSGFGGPTGGGSTTTVLINVNGAIDRVGTAREIRRLLADLDVVEAGSPSWAVVT